MMLYKYMESQWSNKLTEKGQIRLGTLYDFRKEEVYGPEIGDKDEGTILKLWELVIGETYTPETLPTIFKNTKTIIMNPGSKLIGGGGSFGLIESCKNYYILSVSTSLESTIKGQINSKYDSCVQITDKDSFAKAITDKMPPNVPFINWFNCIYGLRTTNKLDDLIYDHVYRKEIKHAYQKEVRAIWGPVENDAKALIIPYSNCYKYCKGVSM